MASHRQSGQVNISTRRKLKQPGHYEDYPDSNPRRSGSSKSVSPSSYSAGGSPRNRTTAKGSASHCSDMDSDMSPGKGNNAAYNFPNWEPAIVHKVRNVYIEKPANPHLGLGFSIRGGAEHGIGIYVSYIEANSVAERQGLEVGDQIVAMNGVRFQRISHEEAAMMIRSAASLDMDVRSVGRVPGSIESLQTYSWVNACGHMVSPPPEVDRVGRYEASMGMAGKLPVMLLKDADERKINLMLHEDARLGFMIRGGNEFGLGVYVTAVDRHSLSESAGLKPGDQILDVNGHSFLDISHSEAVKILKSSRHLIMTVKDVGKIPHSRVMYDQTQWVRGDQMLSRSPDSGSSCGNETYENTFDKVNKPRFVKGAGSQMMHSSTVSNHKTQWGLINDRAQQVLSTEERELLVYYLKGYEGRHITTHALALGIAELLDSPAKSCLVDEIRGMIKPQDLEVFDNMVLKKEGSPKQMQEDPGEVFRQERSVKKPHRHNKAQGMQPRSPSDDSGVDVNNGDQRYPSDQHHSPYKVQDALESYSRTGQMTSSPRQPGNNGKKQSTRRTHQNGTSPTNSVTSNRRQSDDYELWNEGQGQSEVYGRQSYNQYNDGYEELEGLDYHMYPDKSEEARYDNHAKAASRQSKRPIVRGKSLELSHFYGTEVRFDINEGQSHEGHAQGGHNASLSDSDTRPRQGILKGSNGGSARVTRTRREQVPHIKIQDWEEVERKLPVSRDKAGTQNTQSPGSSAKPVTKRTQQKYRLTKDELEMLRIKVRDKLAAIERLKEQRGSPSKKDTPSGSTTAGNSSATKGSSKKSNSTDVNTESERNNGHSEITMRNQTIVKFTDDGTDAHLYGDNWDDARARILNKKGRPLESLRSSDSETSLNSIAVGSERKSQNKEDITLIEGENANGSSALGDLNSGIVKKQLRKITMYKRKATLGLAIEGGGSSKQPLPRIVNIQENGCAYDCDLAKGQLILEVNGRCLRELSHRECAQAIAEAFRDPYLDKVDFLIVDKSVANRTDL